MDADEVLTGRKTHNDTIWEYIRGIGRKPLSREELASISIGGVSIPKINPRPIVKIIDTPKSKGKKPGKGIMLGIEWDF